MLNVKPLTTMTATQTTTRRQVLSQIMTAAWAIFKNSKATNQSPLSFGQALKAAWAQFKATITSLRVVEITIASRPSDVRWEMTHKQWDFIKTLGRKLGDNALQGLFQDSSSSYIIRRTSKQLASAIIDALKAGNAVKLV